MVSRKKPQRPSSAGGDSKLVLVDFSAKEVDEVDGWVGQRGDNYQPDLVKVVDQGWKISLSYSAYYGVYFLSVTGKETGTIYDGFTLSLKHPDFHRLFSVLEWFTLVYLEDKRVELPAQGHSGGW